MAKVAQVQDTYTARVHVSAKNIRVGVPEDGSNCPIADAFKELFPGLTVHVVIPSHDQSGGARVEINPPVGSPLTRIQLPDAAWEFGKAFDAGQEVKPFTFDVEIPTALKGAN